MRYLKQLIVVICLWGCNNTPNTPHKHSQNCRDVFILDFTGGTSPLWMLGKYTFPGIDFSKFITKPNGTLADVPDFPIMVRDQIEVILLAADLGINIEIIVREQMSYRNNVHYTMVSNLADTDDKTTLASAHYDICNTKHYNNSLLYCKSFSDKGPFTIEEWINYFANLTAHEMAHNLGFGHVDEADVPDSIYGELMTPTLSDIDGIKEQRILVEQDICPPGTESATYREIIVQDGESGNVKTYTR